MTYYDRNDIAAIKAAEACLRQAVELRDEFLWIAAHELRTPITPLKLTLRLLETKRETKSGDAEQPAVALRVSTTSRASSGPTGPATSRGFTTCGTASPSID